MGLLSTLSKSNLRKARFETALLVLLFISIYQSLGLIYHGAIYQGLLFILSAACQLRYILWSPPSVFRLQGAFFCLMIPWVALLISLWGSQYPILDWFYILFICTYLLLTGNDANIVNGIGLVILFALLCIIGDFSHAAAQLLPFFVLLVIANLLGRQYQNITSALKHLQTSDPLTGCANREYFQQEVNRASGISQRYKINMSLIALQLDDGAFQAARMGHEKYDQYLVALAQVWTSRLRNTDVLCRYNEGLFLVLLPSTGFESTRSLASDLLKASDAYDFNESEKLEIHTKTVTHDGNEGWEDWLSKVTL